VDVKEKGFYKFTRDYCDRGSTSVGTIPQNTVVEITQVDVSTSKVISPDFFDWHHWNLPVVKVANPPKSDGERNDSSAGKKAKVSLPSGTQQIKDAILLLGECHRKVPACKSKPQEWPSCGCLHCRIEYFILQNGNH